MNEMMSSVPLLMAGVVCLACAVGGWGFYVWLERSKNRYYASDFTAIGEAHDVLERLTQRKEALEATVAELSAELDKMSDRKAELEELRAQLRSAEAELASSRDALEQAARARGELASAQDEMSRVREMHEKLAAEVERLAAEKAEKQEVSNRLDADLASVKAELQQASTTLGELKASAIASEKEAEGWKSMIEGLREREEKARQTAEEAVKAAEAARSEIERLRGEIESLEAQRPKLSRVAPELEESEAKVRAAERELARTEGDLERVRGELAETEKAIAGRKEALDEVVRAKDEVESLRKERTALSELRSDQEIALGKLQAEVLRMKGTLQESPDDDPAADLMREPEALRTRPAQSAAASVDSEINCLGRFSEALKESGLIFSSRTIRSFHTALKCQSINPLTVLAGVSGTGKTLLPIQYANFMGMMQLVISVQPRWDSPQDLFGFYNYLERQYRATELSRLLWAYKSRKDIGDLMSVVLFDEMNLARTEYYFSDFLSKLELRRANSRDADIRLDIAQKTFSMPIPSNMLMVGTMNEDESTQTLSDKVLDRANVLRFGRPEAVTGRRGDSVGIAGAGAVVTKRVWRGWIDEAALRAEDERLVNEWIQSLNEALEGIGRPFGYRVQEAMREYVRLYPAYDANSFRLAFADQIEQKMLPKMRGVDAMSEKYVTCVSRVGDVISQTGDAELEAAFSGACKDAGEQGLFVWNGVSRKE